MAATQRKMTERAAIKRMKTLKKRTRMKVKLLLFILFSSHIVLAIFIWVEGE